MFAPLVMVCFFIKQIVFHSETIFEVSKFKEIETYVDVAIEGHIRQIKSLFLQRDEISFASGFLSRPCPPRLTL